MTMTIRAGQGQPTRNAPWGVIFMYLRTKSRLWCSCYHSVLLTVSLMKLEILISEIHEQQPRLSHFSLSYRPKNWIIEELHTGIEFDEKK